MSYSSLLACSVGSISWTQGRGKCILLDGIAHSQGEGEENAAWHHYVSESHRKDKVSAHTVDVHLLKGIFPPDSHKETPEGSMILANMQRHAILCFYLTSVTADKDITAIFVKMKPWVDCHLKAQLNCLKG